MKTSINFIMFRTSKIEAVKKFYQGIGLELNEEQHGNGPIHYSYVQDQFVIEIYPGTEANTPNWKDSGALMIGFYVENINKVILKIDVLKGKVISSPTETDRGIRAVLEDPDGRRIELIESKEV
ncbi:VOC family protein [Paenibacillus sp. N3.4]|uniref:VOC family protein n=1 Tax=Paenibacillus sp. N3.4 TaxID=2603222 RepID=UPI0011CA0D44|nr:VOC family protein [Paenibacillus sp. N3.4]TXK80685.1 hypothetical protein FU659_17865 [Paenibacillus sp. N3.4]